jgi:hypothetical protein
VRVLVNCRLCEAAIALKLVTTYIRSINAFANTNFAYSHVTE